MNRILSNRISKVMLFCMMAFVIAACDSGGDNDDDDGPLIPNQEGFFVFGNDTIAEDALDPDARMSRAVLDPAQGAQEENMEGVYGKYMYVGANSVIEFTHYEDDVATAYGVEGGGEVVDAEELGNVPLTTDVIYGTLVEDGPALQVAEEGLYYTFVNTVDNTVVLMQVEPQIIGDATEGQWEAGTALPLVSVDEEGAVFEATDVTMYGAAGYRHRFSDGWHAYASPDVVTLNSLGVEDYGAAWDAGTYDVGFFLDNIPSHEDGLYTMRLEFDAQTGEWTETKTKTGDLAVDYSTVEMGLFGNAYEGGDWEVGNGYGLHTPTANGNVYTWTWEDAVLIEEMEFIFLEGAEWGGLEINFEGATLEGSAIDDEQIVNATSVGMEFPNFYVAEGGTYDITLSVDADAGTRTVTIETAE